jgi:hypothetical protein
MPEHNVGDQALLPLPTEKSICGSAGWGLYSPQAYLCTNFLGITNQSADAPRVLTQCQNPWLTYPTPVSGFSSNASFSGTRCARYISIKPPGV